MYKQLTSEQRYTISVLLSKGLKKKEIAEAIGVSNSTITRELQRNSSKRGVYKWEIAQKQAEKRCKRTPLVSELLAKPYGAQSNIILSMNNGRQNKYQDIYIQYATAKAQSFFLKL